MELDLLSTSVRVETPFVIVTIGDYTFGIYPAKYKNTINLIDKPKNIISNYPNFIKSLTANKINGQINTYTLVLEYAIKQGDDPNLLEKILSKSSSNRRIKFSYGDLSAPSYIYKEEDAIISRVSSNISINSSVITYTLTCTSSSSLSQAGTYSFPKVHAKPSDIIKKYLYDESKGLLDIFNGMRNKELVLSSGLIASDDKPVDIEAQPNMNLFNYINYLVNCMTSISDTTDSIINSHKYAIATYDDTSGIFGGPYFKVVRVEKDIAQNTSIEYYTLDVGFPTTNHILSFNIDDDESYSILYDYSNDIQQANYNFRINDIGEVEYQYSPRIALSNTLLKTTQSEKTWWSKVTQMPIKTTLTMQGLVKPAVLMSYVKLNVYFFGRKHISSGYYFISKQSDTINSNGFTTTLNLTRISGDTQW